MDYRIILSMFLVIMAKICAGQQCGENGMRQFDTTMARLVTIGNGGRRFPMAKGAPLKKWCE